jgi:hypothetical protein
VLDLPDLPTEGGDMDRAIVALILLGILGAAMVGAAMLYRLWELIRRIEYIPRDQR